MSVRLLKGLRSALAALTADRLHAILGIVGGAAALTIFALGSSIPAASAETIADLFERVHRSVVVIRALEMAVPAEEGQGPGVSSVGSGVLISNEGKILTGGEVLGIVSHIISKSGGFEGLGFAVAANVARELVLERGAPWHGIDGLFLSDELVRILNLPGPGVLVQRVVPDSTGARLGLRGGFVRATIGERTIILGGDVILKAQGVPIGEAHRLREQLCGVSPGDTLSLTIMRGGRLQELSTVLPRP